MEAIFNYSNGGSLDIRIPRRELENLMKNSQGIIEFPDDVIQLPLGRKPSLQNKTKHFLLDVIEKFGTNNKISANDKKLRELRFKYKLSNGIADVFRTLIKRGYIEGKRIDGDTRGRFEYFILTPALERLLSNE